MQTIEEYLVALKFAPDQAGLAKFNATLADVGKKMSATVGGLASDFFKLQFVLTSGMVAIGSAAVGAMSSFADFDKQMKLGSMTALMGKGAYTELNEALKMAGVTLAQASWDPESHARVLENMRLVHQLNMALGPDAEANAVKIRDFKNQLSQLGEELQFLKFAVGNDLFEKLFGGQQAQDALRHFNEWLLNNLPKIADEISTDLVPVLKDGWEITKDLGDVMKTAAGAFQLLIGEVSGDTSLQTTAVSFHSIATAIEHCIHAADDFLKGMVSIEKIGVHVAAAFADVLSGNFAGAKGEFAAALASFNQNTGTVAGAFGGRMAGKAVGTMAGEAIAGTLGVETGPFDIGITAAGGWLGGKIGGAIGGIGGAKIGHDLAGSFSLPTGLGSLDSMTMSLPPGVVDAVKWMESRGHQFDKNGNVLKSSAGALGIMQLEPSTARMLGVDPNNEADNLRGGTMYLQQLFAKYHDIDKTMAAYNMGPGALDNAIRRYSNDWMKHIPAETRDYVRNGEARMAAGATNNGGDTYNLVVHAQGADANQVAGLVMTRLQDQNAQSARFGKAKMTGQGQ